MKPKTTFFPLLILAVFLCFSACKNSSDGAAGSAGEAKAGSTTESATESTTESAGESSPESAPESTPELVDQLQKAAHDGDLKTVEAKLKEGANVNGMDAEGRTALMLAGFNGHSEIILKLLEEGASINRRDIMGRTALLYTATGPFPEAVKILLDKGANPNVVDSEEHFSPLMHAAAEGNLDVVKILVEAGSDITLTDVDGDNAASFARQSGHLEVASLLEKL